MGWKGSKRQGEQLGVLLITWAMEAKSPMPAPRPLHRDGATGIARRDVNISVIILNTCGVLMCS